MKEYVERKPVEADSHEIKPGLEENQERGKRGKCE